MNIYGTDVRCVVAAGGDGTVASVINELAADVPLAVMGLGNENLFARALALPADPLALALVVSNLPEYALALSFTPAARGDDGVLDWLAFERRGLPALAGYAWAVAHARHHTLAHVRSGRARRLTLTSAAPVPVQLDGNPWGFTQAEVEVLPAASASWWFDPCMLVTRHANLPAVYSDALDSLALAPLWTALHATVQADLRGHQVGHQSVGRVDLPNALWQDRREMRGAFIRAMRSMVAGAAGHGTLRGRSRLARGAPWWLVAALLLWSACSGPPRGPEVTLAPGESRAFAGTWSATGKRDTLRLGPDHRASIVSLTGSLLLTGQRGLGIGFQADVIGMSDNLTGGQGHCVWTDERGDQIFSELRGGPVGSGSVFVGTITGGTGRYAGLTGEYRFRWKYVIDTEEGVISGRTDDLVGRVKAPASNPAGKTAGS